jgi:membrane protease YdiL (CAAX protease family)
MVYSGYATVGAGVAYSAVDAGNRDNNKFEDSLSDRTRRWQWGNQAYMDAGFVSAFHSFRKAAESKKAEGKFLFLQHEETTGDLLTAPLHFEYLLKPSIFIPLMVVGTIGALQTNDPHHSSVWRGDDLAFAGATSVNAGVGEEAMFRGYLVPIMRESWGSDFWSNSATATVFALAHIGSISVPLPQFALGWYLGWRVQKDEWRLSQAVFLHTWWDVIALSAAFAHERGHNIYVPLIHAEF